MGRLAEIWDGWKNFFFPDKEIKILSKKRMEICANCEHASKTVYLHCDKCGCYIPAKARSKDSNCPVGLW